MRIRVWSSDVCSSDLVRGRHMLALTLALDIGQFVAQDRKDPGAQGCPPAKAACILQCTDQRFLHGVLCLFAVAQLVHGEAAHLLANPREEARVGQCTGMALRRSEESRVGKEWVSTVRSRWSADDKKKNQKSIIVNRASDSNS